MPSGRSRSGPRDVPDGKYHQKTMDLVVPALGESITEALIARWLKKVGEPIAPDEPVVDLETDKVSVQLPAPARGVLAEQRFAEGATVKVGEVIGRISEGPVAVAAPPPAPTPTPTPTPTPPPSPAPTPAPAPEPTPAAHMPALSPSRRRALREHGEQTAAFLATAQAPAPTPAPAPAPDEEVVAMTPLRKRIAERLVLAQHTGAVLTTFNEVEDRKS